MIFSNRFFSYGHPTSKPSTSCQVSYPTSLNIILKLSYQIESQGLTPHLVNQEKRRDIVAIIWMWTNHFVSTSLNNKLDRWKTIFRKWISIHTNSKYHTSKYCQFQSAFCITIVTFPYTDCWNLEIVWKRRTSVKLLFYYNNNLSSSKNVWNPIHTSKIQSNS